VSLALSRDSSAILYTVPRTPVQNSCPELACPQNSQPGVGQLLAVQTRTGGQMLSRTSDCTPSCGAHKGKGRGAPAQSLRLTSEGYGSGCVPVPTCRSDTEDKNSRERFLVACAISFVDGCRHLWMWTSAKFGGKFRVSARITRLSIRCWRSKYRHRL